MNEELTEILGKLFKKQLNLLHARIELERIPDYSNIQKTQQVTWIYREIDGSFPDIAKQMLDLGVNADKFYIAEIDNAKIKIKIDAKPEFYMELKIERANARRKELQEQITQLENEVEMLVTDAYINYGIHSQ